MKGWVILLRSGVMFDDESNNVTPALFPTKKKAIAFCRNSENASLVGSKVAKVRIVIYEA
jgi:hypothetical protein